MARVVYCVFDVHLWSQPFVGADFDPRVHFLWSASDFRQMRTRGTKIELANLVLLPLNNELDLRRNHLWPRYQTVASNVPGSITPFGEASDFVWPVRCRPKNLDLTLNGAVWNTNRKVRSTIWLWPFGWSSLLEMDLPAGDEFDDLLDIGIKLRQKDPAPLLLKGKAVGVSGALAHLAQLVKQDLCTPAAQGKAMESTRLPRYVVCAIELQKGFQVRRNISMADRMSLIGAVRGQELDLSKFLSNPPLFTPLGDGNFAVTDFDAGTAIVQRHRQDREGSLEGNHCFYVNTRNFFSIFLTLHRLIAYLTVKSKGDARAAAAASVLASLPAEYRNRLCSDFAAKYAPQPTVPVVAGNNPAAP
ncbi:MULTISPECIES: hypothetical protein [unclassified Bradyrhizobium]|uniref:hypothetical protein n=1 Tax=unclassified Bradyrhizobium TaxID=2631580 RepID=UPI001FF85BAC|nr:MULTISPECIES: hypothetical protein [unclassified Bradyrhizobium]MCK1315885.1 hypothetical protein [Bradyrhizobium sp. 23]MCK1401392.1 hypothetical protein [Bradyrhizobium sp. 39]MCK1408171.1 hypothetical protein [Bradyrhizobium sp. 76]MCK1746408.1 hypothetical protein [Bradyrhizobium sp. 135]UPJ39018.1 hypothetical protein IVB45_37820 [Bradyrhizobium sp. 4]